MANATIKKWQGVGFAILFSCAWMFWLLTDREATPCWAEPINPRAVHSHSDNITLEWVEAELYSAQHPASSHLVAYSNRLFFYGAPDQCFASNLFVISNDNDKISRERIDLGLLFPPTIMTHDDKKLYFGYQTSTKGGPQTDSLVGAGGVIAYDINSGTIIWNTPIAGTYKVSALAALGDKVVVDGGSSSSAIYILETATGKSIAQLEKIDLEPSHSFLEPSASYAFLYNQSGMEQIETAENNLTSIRFWVDNFQNVQQPPLVVNDTWLVRTHAGGTNGRLKAFDDQTGAVLWETDEIVISNVAIANEFAFFLTESATLIGLNTATAEQTVLVQFTSGNVHLQADRGFYVAANENNQLFAYFGDSHQLFAFQFTPPLTLRTE